MNVGGGMYVATEKVSSEHEKRGMKLAGDRQDLVFRASSLPSTDMPKKGQAWAKEKPPDMAFYWRSPVFPQVGTEKSWHV